MNENDLSEGYQERLQQAWDTISLIRAMYQQELTVDQTNEAYIQALQAAILGEAIKVPDTIRLILQVEVPDQENLYINIDVNVRQNGTRLSLRRSEGLSRTVHEVLGANMPIDSIDDAIEYLQTQPGSKLSEDTSETSSTPLSRVWFYFPSLSTREKRDDLIKLAPAYDLTGFCLAGKPGILCLEGEAQSVQSYLADIKRNSWADIPSFQKKVTERYREVDITRQFENMTEITSEIERHGQRGNRGDLSQVEHYLQSHGLHYAFSEVFRV